MHLSTVHSPHLRISCAAHILRIFLGVHIVHFPLCIACTAHIRAVEIRPVAIT
ncbi:unnamed protein product [Mycena citricolor]|uniref:Uncharacterized protein n=1 Tax=Mycena citricolor TaxID=2018698 RepID=A0AAD2HLT3_9AGAR|nr:unnamed protein product [Mycena citricolor]